MSDLSGLIQPCFEAALFAFALIAVYEGARRIAAQGVARVAAALLVVGLAAPVYEGVTSLRYASYVHVQTQMLAHEHADEPPGGWEKAPLTAEQRSTLSRNAAQINFRVSGRLGEWIDADGKRVAFVPAKEDLDSRDGLVRGQKGAEDVGSQCAERGVQLLASAIAFLAIGAVVGAFQRRR